MPPPITFSATLKRICPPWLQAAISGPTMEALGDVFDTATDRMVSSIRQRWPGGGATEQALGYLSKDRKIRRGPAESAAVFATRLPRWLGDHRTRGNPYTLLLQMRLYFAGLLDDTPIDLVYHSGRRFQMPVGATETTDISRDDISWAADGSALWAQIWIFFDVSAQQSPGYPILDEAGDEILDEDGLPILDEAPFASSDITAAGEGVFTSIVKDWLAAHVWKAHLVFLFTDSRLWGYPPPLGTWGSPLPAARTTWGATEAPYIITIEQGV